jgi:hypothetical protein
MLRAAGAPFFQQVPRINVQQHKKKESEENERWEVRVEGKERACARRRCAALVRLPMGRKTECPPVDRTKPDTNNR